MIRDFFYSLSAFVLQNSAWCIETPLFVRYLSMQVKNKNYLKEAQRLARKHKTGILIVSNHTSELDQILLASSLGFLSSLSPLFYIARARKDDAYERARWGWRAFTYRHWFLRLFGAYPILPNQNNYNLTLRDHIRLLRSRKRLVIFPEGGVTRPSYRGVPRGGVGYLALETQCIILPVEVSGIWNMTVKDFWSKNREVVVNYRLPVYSKIFDDVLLKTNPERYQRCAEKILELVYANSTVSDENHESILQTDSRPPSPNTTFPS